MLTPPPRYCSLTRYCSLGHTVVLSQSATQKMTLSLSLVCSHTRAHGVFDTTALPMTHNSCKKEAVVVASDAEMQVHNKPVFVHPDEMKLFLCARAHEYTYLCTRVRVHVYVNPYLCARVHNHAYLSA